MNRIDDVGAPRAKMLKARTVIRMVIKSLVMAWFVKWLRIDRE